MANKPVLFADGPEVLRAVEREYAERLPHICPHGDTGIPQKNHIFRPFFTTGGIGEDPGELHPRRDEVQDAAPHERIVKRVGQQWQRRLTFGFEEESIQGDLQRAARG